jgi:hypothetical protein
MYYEKPGGRHAKPQYGCKRVGSRQEGFHTHFQAILSNYNVSAELAWGVAVTWLNRWNTRMRRLNRGEPDHGTYDLELLYKIGERMLALGLVPAYRDVQFTVEETTERFGIECTPSGLKEAAAILQEGELAPSRLPEVDDMNGGKEYIGNSNFSVIRECVDLSALELLICQATLSESSSPHCLFTFSYLQCL